jgi:hypothetical protein
MEGRPMSSEFSKRRHALWRVRSLLLLLDVHRALRRMDDPKWREQEIEYVRRLAQAQVELDHLEDNEEVA